MRVGCLDPINSRLRSSLLIARNTRASRLELNREDVVSYRTKMEGTQLLRQQWKMTMKVT